MPAPLPSSLTDVLNALTSLAKPVADIIDVAPTTVLAVIGSMVGVTSFITLVTTWKRRVFPKHVPGALGLPWLGSTIPFFTECTNFFSTNHKQHGEIFKAVIGGDKWLCICGDNLTQQVFAVLKTEELGNALVPSAKIIFGTDSLFGTDGPKHRFLKRLFTRVVGPIPINSYLGNMAPVVVRRLKQWESPAGNPQFRDLYLEIKETSLEANLSLFLGKDVIKPADIPALSRDMEAYSAAILAPPINLPFTVFGKGVKARERVRKMITAQAKTRKGAKDISALTHFVNLTDDETGGMMDEKTIEDNVLAMLFASQDTTVAAFICMLQKLWERPELVKAIRKEWGFETKIPNPDMFLTLTAEELVSKEMTRAFFQEALRFQPPVTFTLRKVYKPLDLTLSNGHMITVPKDFIILISMAATMELTNNTPKPTEHDPMRFVGDRAKKEVLGKDKFTFMSFGGGPRLCPGRHQAELLGLLEVAIVALCYDVHFQNPIEFVDTFGPRPKGGKVVLAITRRVV